MPGDDLDTWCCGPQMPCWGAYSSQGGCDYYGIPGLISYGSRESCYAGCIPRWKVCCRGDDCENRWPSDCIDNRGIPITQWASSMDAPGEYQPACYHAYEDLGGNVCADTFACCLDGGGCDVRTPASCFSDNGIIGEWPDPENHPLSAPKTCEEATCPDLPVLCCLCDGQCRKNVASTTFACLRHDGKPITWSASCDLVGSWCANENVQRGCKFARFALSRDMTGTPLDSLKYRPLSIDLMAPHEYRNGPERDNCRPWFANVSAEHGYWTCGQRDKDVAATKQYFKLYMSIDAVTGVGTLWAKYRPVCPEYPPDEEEGVMN